MTTLTAKREQALNRFRRLIDQADAVTVFHGGELLPVDAWVMPRCESRGRHGDRSHWYAARARPQPTFYGRFRPTQPLPGGAEVGVRLTHAAEPVLCFPAHVWWVLDGWAYYWSSGPATVLGEGASGGACDS